jgi:hypothetical protein
LGMTAGKMRVVRICWLLIKRSQQDSMVVYH